jgi:hypothetical protein
MPKKYLVRLPEQERVTLAGTGAKFKGTLQKVRRAQLCGQGVYLSAFRSQTCF